MDDRSRTLVAAVATACLFLAVQLGALALVEPFDDAGQRAVEDPDDPTNSLVYVGAILAATAFTLATLRYDLQWLLRGLVVAISALFAWFVLAAVVPPTAGGNAVAIAAALAVGIGLVVHPEWYVIDAAGVVTGAGAAGLFGISFGLLPAIVLLVVLAVYDAVSVYRTGHMLDLAEGVMDLKIPVVLVVPTTPSYSFLATDHAAGAIEGDDRRGRDRDAASSPGGDPPGADGPVEGDGPRKDGSSAADELPGGDEPPAGDLERDALFVGLGDAVIPTILVASAATFLETPAIDVPGIVLTVPALGAILGTLAGLAVLLSFVFRGRAHAGLPVLNAGAIGGYLLGAAASGVPVATALGL